MIEKENQIPFIGYGGMLNSPAALIGTDPAHAAEVISSWDFVGHIGGGQTPSRKLRNSHA